MLTHLDGFRTTLTGTLKASDTVLKICSRAGVMLNTLSIGDEVYLTIEDCRKYEVVKYTHTGDVAVTGPQIEIPVERRIVAVDSFNFPAMTTVKYEINGYILNKVIEGL